MKNSRVLPLYFILAGVVCICWAYLYSTGAFTVKKVTCMVEQSPCPEDVSVELQNLIGSSLFFTDFDQVGRQMISYVPSFLDVQIRKNIAGELNVRFLAAQEKYVLEKNDQGVWKVDEAGVITAVYTKGEFPRYRIAPSFSFSLEQGNQVPAELHQYLIAFPAQLAARDISVQEVRIVSSSEVQLFLNNKKQVLLSLKNASLSLAKLEILLKKFDFSQIKEPIEAIDLRFQHPILKVQGKVDQKISTQ